MPLKRKYAPKKKMIRRKVMSRPIRAPRRPDVYHFKRKVFLKDYAIVSTTDFRGSIQFALVDLPSATDFTNLYDQYRFNKVVVKLIPKFTEVGYNAGSSNNANCQQIHSVLDFDDNSAPTSINQLCEYQSHKMTRGNQMHTRILVPKVQSTVLVGGAGVTASAAPRSKQWLDCDQNSIAHRGVKLIIPASATAGTTVSYDAELTYYISCKNVL